MTLLEITNMALDLLGQKHIQSFDNTDRLSRLCSTWANSAYKQTLREYRPNFAIVEKAIVYDMLAEAYMLPSDYVLVISTASDTYTISSNTIKLDSDGTDPLMVEYVTSDLTILEYASDLFIQALALTIASKLAFPLTKEAGIANSLSQQADTLWTKFNFSNNKERRPSRLSQSLTRSTSKWTRNR